MPWSLTLDPPAVGAMYISGQQVLALDAELRRLSRWCNSEHSSTRPRSDVLPEALGTMAETGITSTRVSSSASSAHSSTPHPPQPVDAPFSTTTVNHGSHAVLVAARDEQSEHQTSAGVQHHAPHPRPTPTQQGSQTSIPGLPSTMRNPFVERQSALSPPPNVPKPNGLSTPIFGAPKDIRHILEVEPGAAFRRQAPTPTPAVKRRGRPPQPTPVANPTKKPRKSKYDVS